MVGVTPYPWARKSMEEDGQFQETGRRETLERATSRGAVTVSQGGTSSPRWLKEGRQKTM